MAKQLNQHTGACSAMFRQKRLLSDTLRVSALLSKTAVMPGLTRQNMLAKGKSSGGMEIKISSCFDSAHALTLSVVSLSVVSDEAIIRIDYLSYKLVP